MSKGNEIGARRPLLLNVVWGVKGGEEEEDIIG
jgi:hypothetical protein